MTYSINWLTYGFWFQQKYDSRKRLKTLKSTFVQLRL